MFWNNNKTVKSKAFDLENKVQGYIRFGWKFDALTSLIYLHEAF